MAEKQQSVGIRTPRSELSTRESRVRWPFRRGTSQDSEQQSPLEELENLRQKYSVLGTLHGARSRWGGVGDGTRSGG